MNQSVRKMSVAIDGKINGMWNGQITRCFRRKGMGGCGKEIGWAQKDNGVFVPFDLNEMCTLHYNTCRKMNKNLRPRPPDPKGVDKEFLKICSNQ